MYIRFLDNQIFLHYFNWKKNKKNILNIDLVLKKLENNKEREYREQYENGSKI